LWVKGKTKSVSQSKDMLRSIFVLFFVTIGAYYALQAPFYALLFYIGNAYFRPEDWVWWNFVSSLNLSLISGAYLVLITLFGTQRLIWNRRVALLWIFLLQTLLSTLGSEHFSYSWGYWTDFLKTIVITYLIVVLVDDFSKFRLLLLVMVLALGVEQARQGWVYLLTSPGWHNTNVVSFLGDNNGVAIGMLMLTPIVGLLGQTTNKKWAKAFYWLVLVGCLYRALSTYSRGGFVAAIAMGGAWCMRSRRKMRALLGAVVVITIVFTALPDTFWNRMGTIETYEERQDESALGRLHFWEVAAQMANANPLRGVGYNGYNLSYNKYDFSGGIYGINRSVHSSFFAVLAELGYLGTFLFVIVIFSALRSCSRVRTMALRETAFSDLGKSAIALQTGLVAFLVGGSFVIFQYSEMLWHVIGLTIVVERLAKQRQAEIVSGERLATSVSSVPAKVSNAA
jgi:putative inorganic carbon (hco3(-)) transporter